MTHVSVGSGYLLATFVVLAVATACCGGDADPVLLDCSRGIGQCVERKPEGRFANVRYITDQQNLIDVPFTRERFDVEFPGFLLRRPWDLEFLPDGSMLVTLRTGRIVHIENRTQLPAYDVKPVVLSLTGLLGLAVSPDFETNRHVYIYYSHARGEPLPEERDEEGNLRTQVVNKISRLTMSRRSLYRETTILDGIPGSGSHSGGRLEFGPDGKLYATTGDASVPERTQDPSFLGGKILRINPDGSVPADNPIPGSPVYSIGHRNPQGLAWNPLTGEMFASEHGHRRMDEINRIRPGRNYGWGAFECRRPTGKVPPLRPVTFPVVCFNRYTMAPSGMEFVADEESPWYGSLFVGGLRGAHLRRFEFQKGRVARDEIFFVAEGRDYIPADAADLGGRGLDVRIRDVEYHAGSLYVIGDRFGMARITPR